MSTIQRARVDSCCICLTLKQGTLIIGYFSTISILISIIMVSTGHMKEIMGSHNESMQIVLLVLYTISLLLNILLIVGASLKKPGIMLPWITVIFFSILVLIMCSTGITIIAFVHADVLQAFLLLLGFFIIIVIQVYIWLVVFSYYQEISNETVPSTTNQR